MIVAIDFDGTIVADKWPDIGVLQSCVADFIKFLQANDHIWILWTMREGEKLQQAVDFCKANGLYPNFVNDNVDTLKEHFGNNPRKIYADIYIDDHFPLGIFDQVLYAHWAIDLDQEIKNADIQTKS